jgi:hypothetical protein
LVLYEQYSGAGTRCYLEHDELAAAGWVSGEHGRTDESGSCDIESVPFRLRAGAHKHPFLLAPAAHRADQCRPLTAM